jgi:hypothetical protein
MIETRGEVIIAPPSSPKPVLLPSKFKKVLFGINARLCDIWMQKR